MKLRIPFVLFCLSVLVVACAPAQPSSAPTSEVPEPSCIAKTGESGALHIAWDYPGEAISVPDDVRMYDLVVYIAGNYPDAPVRTASERSFGETVFSYREKGRIGIAVDGYTVSGYCPDKKSTTVSVRDGDVIMLIVNMLYIGQSSGDPFTTRSMLFKVIGPDPKDWKPVDSLIWDPSFHNETLLADFTDAMYRPELAFTCGERTYAVIGRRGANIPEQIQSFDFRRVPLTDRFPIEVTIERIDATTVRFACYPDQQTYMLDNLTATDSIWVATQVIDKTSMTLVAGPVR